MKAVSRHGPCRWAPPRCGLWYAATGCHVRASRFRRRWQEASLRGVHELVERIVLAAAFCALLPLPSTAQTCDEPATPAADLPQPTSSPERAGAVGRWLELHTASLSLRHRFVDDSTGVVTTNQLQHREALAGRFKLDPAGRYALNFGLFTGVRFTSGWDNTGWGRRDAQGNVSLKVLYVAARPVLGVEAQIGGLSITRGESTELTTYDEDGYIMGERISVRRPRELFFDEVSVTSAYFVGGTGPEHMSVTTRLPHISRQNYQQYLLAKRAGRRAAVSADYSAETGRRTWRQAISVAAEELHVIDSLRFEAYQRTTQDPAFGFAMTIRKAVTARLLVNGGYASIDPLYGPLNADRFTIGNRVFAMATYAFLPELTASLFITRAVGRNGPLPQRTLTNVVVTYNALMALKRTGLF